VGGVAGRHRALLVPLAGRHPPVAVPVPEPGELGEGGIYEAMGAGKQVKKIPMTFGDALDALEADEVVRQALPGDMYRVFMHYKRDEWERYCATVSDWDVAEYLDVLP